MTRWNLTISEKDRQDCKNLSGANRRKKGDLSKFVDEAVRKEIFHQTVKEMKEWNAERDQQELMDLVDEAVDRFVRPSLIPIFWSVRFCRQRRRRTCCIRHGKMVCLN